MANKTDKSLDAGKPHDPKREHDPKQAHDTNRPVKQIVEPPTREMHGDKKPLFPMARMKHKGGKK